MIQFLSNFPTLENATYSDRQILLAEAGEPGLLIKWLPLPFPYECDLTQLISPFWASTSPLCKIREGRKERLLSLRSLLAIAACGSNLTPFSICSFLAKFPSNLGQVTCLQRTLVFCL